MRVPLLTAIERQLWIRRERAKLARVVSAPADTSVLGRVDDASVRALLVSADTERRWQVDEPVLRRLALPDGTGGVNPGDRRALYYLIAGLRPSKVLEIGTHIGASTVHIAAALASASDVHSPKLVSVDISDVNDPIGRPWQSYGSNASPRAMIQALELDFVEFEVLPSLDYLTKSKEKFDFIFLDGDHSASTVYRELPAAMRCLTPGGFVLLHDYFPDLRPLWSDGSVLPGPFLAVERLSREYPALRVIPLGALPWSTKLGSNVTNLTLVTRT